MDSRFKTSDSKSDSDFTLELPRPINIPDDTTQYINDIGLPVAWSTIDERNNKSYDSISHNVNGRYDTSYWILPTEFTTYNGTTLADEMMAQMNDGLYDNMKEQLNLILIILILGITLKLNLLI